MKYEYMGSDAGGEYWYRHYLDANGNQRPTGYKSMGEELTNLLGIPAHKLTARVAEDMGKLLTKRIQEVIPREYNVQVRYEVVKAISPLPDVFNSIYEKHREEVLKTTFCLFTGAQKSRY